MTNTDTQLPEKLMVNSWIFKI